jgi:hypothetical protein
MDFAKIMPISLMEELQLNSQSLNKPGRPEYLVGPALFFVIDDGIIITSQTMVNDGGLTFH